MESLSVFDVVKEVLSSWQVIVVTIAVFLYMQLVSHTARRYHRPNSFKKIKVEIFKKKQKSSVSQGTDEMLSDSNTNDDLGLEEA